MYVLLLKQIFYSCSTQGHTKCESEAYVCIYLDCYEAHLMIPQRVRIPQRGRDPSRGYEFIWLRILHVYTSDQCLKNVSAYPEFFKFLPSQFSVVDWSFHRLNIHKNYQHIITYKQHVQHSLKFHKFDEFNK